MVEGELTKLLSALNIPVATKRHNGWWVTPCPFAPWTHRNGRDGNPSFGVKVENEGISSFKCLTCGEHGNLTKLVRKLGVYREFDSHELEKQIILAEAAGVLGGDFEQQANHFEYPEPLNEAAFGDIFNRVVDEGGPGLAYMYERGLTQETLTHCDVRYDPMERRVLFPVRGDDGLLYGYTGRAIDADTQPKVKDYLGLKKRALLLGAQFYEPGRPVVVVEGLIGWLSVWDAMIIDGEFMCTPVAIMGNQMTDQQVEILCRWNEKVFLLLDDDFGGNVGLWGPLNVDGQHEGGGAVDDLIDHVPVYVPAYPEGWEGDIDNVCGDTLRRVLSVQPVAPPLRRRGR